MTTCLLALLVLATFLIRFLPRCLRPNAIVSDTYFHLYCAELIRSNRFRHSPELPTVMLKHRNTYPFGYHYLLALFPAGARAWAERGTGAFFDAVNVLIVHRASLWFLRGTAHAGWIALAAAFLYAFSPALLRVGSGPRSYNGSARVPGQTLFLTHILSAYLAWSTGSLAWGALSVTAGAVLLFTATFSTQVFFLFGLGFCLFITPWHLLLMATSIGVSVAITGGGTLGVLQGRIAHSTIYFTHLQRIFLYPHIFTFRKYLGQAREALGQLLKGEFREFVHWFLHTNYYLHLLVAVFPQVVLLGFLGPWRGLPDARFLLVWTGCGVVWFLVTRRKAMLFLGEGERYLEAAMLPTLLLFTLGAWKHAPWLLAGLMAYFACTAWYFVRDYLAAFRALDEDHGTSEALFQTLRELPPGPLLPVGNVYWQAIQRCPHPVLTSAMLDSKLLPIQEFLEVFGNYPYPGKDFTGITERYGIRYILAPRDGLEHYLKLIEPAAFTEAWDLIQESPHMLLYGRKGTVPPPPREAFLHEPDWTASTWAEVVLAYVSAFEPSDPVALVLPYDPGVVPLEEAQEAILELVRSLGLSRFPDVVLSVREELLQDLRGYDRIQWVPDRSLEGEMGTRFARAWQELDHQEQP